MAEHPNPGPRRRFKVILALSLGLNLLFIGLIAGSAWRHAGGPDKPKWTARGFAAPYVHALPRDQRREVFRVLRAERRGAGKAARTATYKEMITALRREPFDGASVRTLLADQRGRALSVQQATEEKWMALLQAMTASERAAFADRLEELIRRGPHRKNSKHSRD